MNTSSRSVGRARRLQRIIVLPHAVEPPPAANCSLRLLRKATTPHRATEVFGWIRAHGCAGTLASLGRAYLAPTDAAAIESLLRAGRHEPAAQRFFKRFSDRCFPLEYPWTGDASGRLLVELTRGIQHEGYGESWEEYGDLWSLKPVFLLSWSLMEDPYGALRDEFVQDEIVDQEQASPDRLCDEAREAIAQLAELPVEELFSGVPSDGFPVDQLRPRLTGTRWEPLLWAAPWLWCLSGNSFLDQRSDDFAEPEPWSLPTVLRVAAEFREALRVMRAIDAFNTWLCQRPADRARSAVQAALGPPSDRISSLLDLPIVDVRAGCSHSPVAPAP